MTLVSTGQLTISDLHDLTYGSLSSEVGLVPCDASGVPKIPLSSVPLTTVMTVYKGNQAQSGWTFSRTQSNATSSVNTTSGVLTVTAISADTAHVDITASKPGEPSITKRYSISKVYQGEDGLQGLPGQDGADGMPGSPAIVALITNDSHVVPTDMDGNNGNYSGCSTTMKIFIGTVDDSANWSVAASSSSGVTGSLSGKTYTVTAMSVDSGYVDMTATRSGYPSLTCRFAISKSKQGLKGDTGDTGLPATAYWLVTSVAVIKQSLTGTHTPDSITLAAKSQTGSATPIGYSGRFVIKETSDGSTWTTKYTSATNESTKIYVPSEGIRALKCELFLAGDTSVLLDEETIPVVNDGPVGDKGEPGDQGPPGNPKMLGIHTSGLQIQLRGFYDDGTFGDSTGYVYIGSERVIVSQADYAVSSSATRSGFIIIDSSSIFSSRRRHTR